MHKISIKKLSLHLSNHDNGDVINMLNAKSYELKSQESLKNKLDRRLPIQVALIKNKACVLLLKMSGQLNLFLKNSFMRKWVAFVSKLK